jgi:hypothetical protein
MATSIIQPSPKPNKNTIVIIKKKPLGNDQIVILAILTVLANAVLAYFTISVANSTSKVADVAKQSSDAALSTERATIVEVIRQFNVSDAYWASIYYNSPTMPPVLVSLSVTIGLKNYGKTPGTVRDFFAYIKIGSLPPESIVYHIIDHAIVENTIPYGRNVMSLPSLRQWRSVGPSVYP